MAYNNVYLCNGTHIQASSQIPKPRAPLQVLKAADPATLGSAFRDRLHLLRPLVMEDACAELGFWVQGFGGLVD